MNITERQLQILEALARFKFLTSDQIAKLFKLKNTNSINTLLLNLKERKRPLVDYKEFGLLPLHGRLARMHFLTSYGKDIVQEDLGYSPESIKFVKNSASLYRRDYFHRRDTVTFNMYFQQWLANNGYQLEFFNYYFDRTGSNRNNTGETLNSLQVKDFKIVPDGIGLFNTPERPYLFLFEQHNGKDKMRAVNQIAGHCMAISQGSASDKYEVDKAARVYYVYEEESCKRAVMKELRDNPNYKDVNKYFLFKTMESLQIDFYTGWQHFNGELVNFI